MKSTGTLHVPPLCANFCAREATEPIAAPLEGVSEEGAGLLTFFKSCHDQRTRAPLTSTEDARVAVILEICHAYPDLFSVRVGGDQDSLANNTNKFVRDFGEGRSSATREWAACSTLSGSTARTGQENAGFSR